MKARFEYFENKYNKFQFRFISATGEVVVTSDMYASRKDCLNGIEILKAGAYKAAVVEVIN